MSVARLQKGDQVVVITGKDKGKKIRVAVKSGEEIPSPPRKTSATAEKGS
jgi:hypothetical protein